MAAESRDTQSTSMNQRKGTVGSEVADPVKQSPRQRARNMGKVIGR